MWNVARTSFYGVSSVFLAIFLGMTATGCVELSAEVGSSSTPTTSASASPAPSVSLPPTFAGATKATNLDGSNIKISWVGFSKAVIYNVNLVNGDGSWTVLARVKAPAVSFIHAGLTAGLTYSYVVQECDSSGNCDTNTNIVSAIAFAGVTSVSNLGNVEATFNFNPGLNPSAAAYDVFCALTTASPFNLVGSVTAPAYSVSVTGLLTYTNYVCRVNAVTLAGQLDGNTATITMTTRGYQGFQLVNAYGPVTASAPPTGQPAVTEAILTWLKFVDDTAGTNYKLVRVARGSPVDMTTTTYCTSSLLSSCLVCMKPKENTASTSLTCTDTNVASSPQQYDYLVSDAPLGTVANSTAWTLPVSDTSYRTSVPIPPASMALVHRDSVNYEFCELLGLIPDPLNHQRCWYSGLGAVPYNTNPGNPPLNLPSTHYDFGYDLFVDRWNTGCDYISNGAGPPSGVGTVGSTYYDTTGGGCYINQDGATTWIEFNSDSTASQVAHSSTNDPRANGTHAIPPIQLTNQISAYNACQSKVDTNYGAKRLFRKREFVAAAAWAISGEPGAVTDAQISALENGTNLPVTSGCNSNSASSIVAGAFGTTTVSNNSGVGPLYVNMASTSTYSCVSRFGIQDLVGNILEWTSDQVGASSGAPNFITQPAPSLDAGDLDFNNLIWDGLSGAPGGQPLSSFALSALAPYNAGFIVPLGQPVALTASAGLGGVELDNSTNGFLPFKVTHVHSNVAVLNNSASSRGGIVVGGNYLLGAGSGRYMFGLQDPVNSTAGFRCVLPAE